MSKIATMYQQEYGNGQYSILLENGDTVHDLDPYDIMGLYSLMASKDIQYLWVYPHMCSFNFVTLADIDQLIDSDLFDWHHPAQMPYNGHPYCLRMRRKQAGCINRYVIWPNNFEVASPRKGDKGQWQLPTPAHLNRTVHTIENEVGMPFVWTCGKMGENVLRRSHDDTHGHTVIRPFVKSQAALFEHMQRKFMDRITWRTYILDMLQGRYIIGIDKNAQYVGASFVRIGNGGFREAHSRELHEKVCGFWQYKIVDVSESAFDGRRFPCPLDVNREWAGTDLILAAYDMGVSLNIYKGIVWDESGRYLEKWASEMWRHRRNMRVAYEEFGGIEYSDAERTFKAMANAMIGRYMNEYAKEYYHPDWNWMIIHKAIANMTYTLSKLYNNGIMPILVNKDAIYWLSDTPVVPFALHEQELRGYKLIGVCEMDEHISEMIVSRRGVNDIELAIKGRMLECASHQTT